MLSNALVASASPLAGGLDAVKRMEDAGAGAVVLPSLFEEQLEPASHELDFFPSHGSDSYAEAAAYLTEPTASCRPPDRYLELVAHARRAVTVPVIASLNGVSSGGWTRHRHRCRALASRWPKPTVWPAGWPAACPGRWCWWRAPSIWARRRCAS